MYSVDTRRTGLPGGMNDGLAGNRHATSGRAGSCTFPSGSDETPGKCPQSKRSSCSLLEVAGRVGRPGGADPPVLASTHQTARASGRFSTSSHCRLPNTVPNRATPMTQPTSTLTTPTLRATTLTIAAVTMLASTHQSQKRQPTGIHRTHLATQLAVIWAIVCFLPAVTHLLTMAR